MLFLRDNIINICICFPPTIPPHGHVSSYDAQPPKRVGHLFISWLTFALYRRLNVQLQVLVLHLHLQVYQIHTFRPLPLDGRPQREDRLVVSSRAVLAPNLVAQVQCIVVYICHVEVFRAYDFFISISIDATEERVLATLDLCWCVLQARG